MEEVVDNFDAICITGLPATLLHLGGDTATQSELTDDIDDIVDRLDDDCKGK